MLGVIGNISPPLPLQTFGGIESGGLGNFLNVIFKILIAAGGIYALFNFIIAGYGFLSAGGDPKAISAATAKIWQTLIGLLLIAGSFVLAAILGWLMFGNANAIINPSIPTLY